MIPDLDARAPTNAHVHAVQAPLVANDELLATVDLDVDGNGTVEADLEPEERRQRMWWRKAVANFRSTFDDFDFYRQLESLPDNEGGVGPWFELPDRLKS